MPALPPHMQAARPSHHATGRIGRKGGSGGESREPGDQPLQRTLPRDRPPSEDRVAGEPLPAWWAPNGFAAIPTAALDPPHGAASPAVPALIGSGRYLAGAECDGATYPAMATAGDRNRVRQIVLKNLGWTIRQVWSTDDFIDTDAALDRVLSVRVAQARVPAERERRRREDPCRAQAATTGHEDAARRGLPPCRDGAKKGDRLPRCRRPRADGRSLPGEIGPHSPCLARTVAARIGLARVAARFVA